MKAIVVGLGSMGRRRIRLLEQYGHNICILGVDTREDRRKQAESEFHIKTAASIGEAQKNIGTPIEIAFISTSPLSHASIIKECLNQGIHVFTELNLVNTGYDENIQTAKKRGLILFQSSTFLYRKEIQYIKEAVNRCNCPLSYVYHVGQYLPDWHPWENYKDFFVGNRATNGCRELMAVEFPWLIDVFGDIEQTDSFHSKISRLYIDYPDSYHILFHHENGHTGSIAIDVVSRKAVRNLEIYGEGLYLSWDGTPNGLMQYDFENCEEKRIPLYESVNQREEYSASIIEDAYYNEVENFIDVVKGNSSAKYSIEKDRYVLSIIDRIEGVRQ